MRARVAHVTGLVEELTSQRAEERIGERVEVLVESVDDETGGLVGRTAHQGPEVDGTTSLLDAAHLAVGDLVAAEFIGSDGVDLVARPMSRP